MADSDIYGLTPAAGFGLTWLVPVQQGQGYAFTRISFTTILAGGLNASFGTLAATDTTNATSKTVAAVVFAGGLGIAKTAYVGELVDVVGVSRLSGFLLRPDAGASTTVGARFIRSSGAPGATAETGAQYLRSSAGRGTSNYMNVDGATEWVPLAGFDRKATASWPTATASGWQIWDTSLSQPAYSDGASAVYSVGQINSTEALTGAGGASRSKRSTTVSNATGGTYAITLAAPAAEYRDFIKVISMTAGDATNKVTLSLSNVVGGSAATTATFSAAGHTLVLYAIQTGASTWKWLVLKEQGVVLT